MTRIPRNLDATTLQGTVRTHPMFAIGEAVIASSERLLCSRRGNDRESIVYWAGVKRNDFWFATTVVKPRASRTRGSFATSAADNGRVIQFLSDAGLALLGQVHTHPGLFVDHSIGDDEQAFMPKENSLSIVVANFGRQGMRPMARCGVHRYEHGHFRRLDVHEIEADICIVPLVRNLARGGA